MMASCSTCWQHLLAAKAFSQECSLGLQWVGSHLSFPCLSSLDLLLSSLPFSLPFCLSLSLPSSLPPISQAHLWAQSLCQPLVTDVQSSRRLLHLNDVIVPLRATLLVASYTCVFRSDFSTEKKAHNMSPPFGDVSGFQD